MNVWASANLPLAAAVVAVLGYLLGSIPFGVLITRFAGVGDVRKIGSGNIGATNVLRTGRKDLAAATLLLDGGKGAAAVGLAWWAFHDAETRWVFVALAGGGAFLGHLFPVWLRFRGGKGVATFFGTVLAAAWPVGLLAAATWLLMAFLLRWSSLAALTAAALAPVFAFATGAPLPILYLTVFMAVLIFIRHHENIRRLLNGTEPKIGAKKTAAAEPAETA